MQTKADRELIANAILDFSWMYREDKFFTDCDAACLAELEKSDEN